MKKSRKALIMTIIMTLVITCMIPVTVSAEVKGSTQYLVNQAKNPAYVGKTLSGVKSAIRAEGYNGWRMDYDYHWCAWYVANCANCAYIGNYPGAKQIKKSTYVDEMADYFADFNGTKKKSPRNYKPKAGDIVVENGEGHIGIMISSKKAAYGNDGSSVSWPYTKVVVRKPVNVSYYVPRPNWYIVHYSDNLYSTTVDEDMAYNPQKKAYFGKNVKISTKKFKWDGYYYTHYYMYKHDFNQKTKKDTYYYWSQNKKTGKRSWVKEGTKGYKKVKFKVGSKFKFYYNSSFAGAMIVLTPAWIKK